MTWREEEPDDRMLDLLQRLKTATDAMEPAMRDYVRDLRAWADVTRVSQENSIGLCNALLAHRGVGDMTEAAIAHTLRRTDHDINTDLAWRRLCQSAEAFFAQRIQMVRAQAAVTGYITYMETLADNEREVPRMLTELTEQFEDQVPRGARPR